jgi:hypothetical protein
MSNVVSDDITVPSGFIFFKDIFLQGSLEGGTVRISQLQ